MKKIANRKRKGTSKYLEGIDLTKIVNVFFLQRGVSYFPRSCETS